MLSKIKHFVMIVSHSSDNTNSCGPLIENAIQKIVDTIGTASKDSIAIGFDGDGTKKGGKPWDVAPRVAVNMVDRLNNGNNSSGEVKLLQATALENIRTKPARIYNNREGSVMGKNVVGKTTHFNDNKNFFSFAYENASDTERSKDMFTRDSEGKTMQTSHLSYNTPFDTDRGFFRNGSGAKPWETCVCTKDDNQYVEWGGYNTSIHRFVGSTAVWEWLIREKMYDDVQVHLVVIWNDYNPDIPKDKPFAKSITFKTYEAARNGLLGRVQIYWYKMVPQMVYAPQMVYESVNSACNGLDEPTIAILDKSTEYAKNINLPSRCHLYKTVTCKNPESQENPCDCYHI
jgi:hypothetical protein